MRSSPERYPSNSGFERKKEAHPAPIRETPKDKKSEIMWRVSDVYGVPVVLLRVYEGRFWILKAFTPTLVYRAPTSESCSGKDQLNWVVF